MGEVFVGMTYGPLDIQKAITACHAENCGAEILFLGTVRNKNEGRAVKAVNYDGHLALGNKILEEICSEVKSKWGETLNLWIEHRLGFLSVGEVSLIIHVTSPHRDSAYMASRYIIEEIKLRLPVWKEEIYCEGDREWLKGQTLNKI